MIEFLRNIYNVVCTIHEWQLPWWIGTIMIVAGMVCVFICHFLSDNDDAGMSAVLNFITAFISAGVFGFCSFSPWPRVGDLGEILIPVSIVLSLIMLVYGIVVFFCLIFGDEPMSGLLYLLAIFLIYSGFIIMADIIWGMIGVFILANVMIVGISTMLFKGI